METCQSKSLRFGPKTVIWPRWGTQHISEIEPSDFGICSHKSLALETQVGWSFIRPFSKDLWKGKVCKNDLRLNTTVARRFLEDKQLMDTLHWLNDSDSKNVEFLFTILGGSLNFSRKKGNPTCGSPR